MAPIYGYPEAAKSRGALKWLAAKWPGMAPCYNHDSHPLEHGLTPADWQAAYWGPHLPRLTAIKDAVDPHGIFNVWQGVGYRDTSLLDLAASLISPTPSIDLTQHFWWNNLTVYYPYNASLAGGLGGVELAME